MTTASMNGSCLCRAVKYRVSGEVLGFQYCHCSRCRKVTGSAHAANLFVRPPHLEWLQGEDNLGRYMLAGDPKFPSSFCKTCGSTMPSLSSTGRYWVVPAGALDEDPGITPTQSIFWDSRAPWYKDVPALPKHAELPPRPK